ncbi:MAG: dethiobiotin synthase [Gammaproteobacteria bacterium]|jgi:dethiobiotin synthetase|nr:dethiobiotin synthase [Gammaproteobacteria bacterium]
MNSTGRFWFVTGTDTGVGKTFVAAGLLAVARSRGLSTLGLKPVAAGCEERDGQWGNEDAWALQQHSSVKPAYTTVNPVALREPMAPHIAAEREGRALALAALATHCRSQFGTAEFGVVEGAGGWLVPLNADHTLADLAQQLGCDVVLVVGMRLGCINHALLTAAAIRAAGLRLAGWVANHIDPEMAVQDENVAALAERLDAPLLGRVPYQPGSGHAAAAHLDIRALTG